MADFTSTLPFTSTAYTWPNATYLPTPSVTYYVADREAIKAMVKEAVMEMFAEVLAKDEK